MTTTHGPITFQAFAPAITLDRETRTIRGEITVFGVPTTDYRRIVIHEGALQPRLPLSRVKLLIDHDQRQPVGFMKELTNKGRTAAFTVPEGEAGDKALSDAEAKLRDGLSVGIQVLSTEGAFVYDEETDTYNVYAAELVEVSLCAIPAYADAGVTSVAASLATEQPTPKEITLMAPTLTAEDLDARLAAAAEEQERALEARLAALSTAPPSGPVWPTFGAFVKELSTGSPEAMEFYKSLAYTGAKTSDDAKRNTWVADAIHLVNKNRKILNSFTVEPLPEEGMTLEYVKLKSNSMLVEKQATEGADLKFGKLALESDTAAVDTYGGYTEITRQIMDRASAAYTTTAFTAMDLEYARATEAAARALLKATIAAQITAGNKLNLAASADTDDWLDLIVDAAELYEERGYTLEGGKVSKDVFKQLMRLEDTAGNRLMLVSGTGVNQVGELDVSGLTGKIASVKFELFPGADAKTLSFYDPLAITTWESPGAPFQLQDENVINLSSAFSKFGYLAQASQHPQALLPVVIAAP